MYIERMNHDVVMNGKPEIVWLDVRMTERFEPQPMTVTSVLDYLDTGKRVRYNHKELELVDFLETINVFDYVIQSDVMDEENREDNLQTHVVKKHIRPIGGLMAHEYELVRSFDEESVAIDYLFELELKREKGELV